MSTTTDPRESAATVEAPAAPVVRVTVPKRSLGSSCARSRSSGAAS